MTIDRSFEKKTGAFRGLVFNHKPHKTFGKCDVCGMTYENSEISRARQGLGSYAARSRSDNDPINPYTYRSKEREAFVDLLQRCICDLDGDVEVVEGRAELMVLDMIREASKPARPTNGPLKAPTLPPGAGQIIPPKTSPAPPAKPQRSKPTQQNLADQLTQLSDLYSAGALSAEQYEAAKNKLLGL
jgi:hypothetical protein